MQQGAIFTSVNIVAVTASLRSSRIAFIALGIAVGLSVFEALGVIVTNASQGGPQDWRVFADAGARVGSFALLHPARANDVFAYTPGFAWALLPFAQLPHAVGFAIDVAIMCACAFASARIAVELYALRASTALAIVFGWTPVLNAIAVGQNSTLGLLLSLVSIVGLTRGATLLTALPIGLLCYKPTYALPLIGVLVVRGRWRALSIVCAIAGCWYLVSVAATGGAWNWPAQWLAMVARYSGADFAFNAVKATSLPALLLRASAPLWLVIAVSCVVLAFVIVALRRVDIREAGSAAVLAGLALSPHAWPYDAALAVPMLALGWISLAPRWVAIEAIVMAVSGPLFLVSSLIGCNPQAIVVVGGTAAWLRLRVDAPRA